MSSRAAALAASPSCAACRAEIEDRSCTVCHPPGVTAAGAIQSFWMGGYEGADHINGLGAALDMAAASGHVDQLEADHRRAAALGIGTVRESVGWRLAEPAPGVFDLRRAKRVARSAQRHGLQVVWSFMHYGTPADVSLLDDSFCHRFVAFALAVARAVGRCGSRPPVYNLINEISFQCWAVSCTDMMQPYRSDPQHGADRLWISGDDVKQRLVRATLMATAAIRRLDPTARFLQVEPLIHIAPPRHMAHLAPEAEQASNSQWQAWDMLARPGDVPSLQGLAPGLDLVGVNHYHEGQWELGSGARLAWHHRDDRRLTFADLLQRAWLRYGRPLVVSETSHIGEGRAEWLHDIAANVARARAAGVVVDGICLYPLVDRPDWSDPTHWHRSGLWDVDAAVPSTDAPSPPPQSPKQQHLRRVLCPDYAAALGWWQSVLPGHTGQALQAAPKAAVTAVMPLTVAQAAVACNDDRAHVVHHPIPANRAAPRHHLIVFSHLRWCFVWQRPQQLLSRLARHATGPLHVWFVEEPLHTDGRPRMERVSQGPHIDVLIPHTPLPAQGFDDAQMPLLRSLLRTALADAGIQRALFWLYTPLALPLVDVLHDLHGEPPLGVVFDCIDELWAFALAPPHLPEREPALLQRADLVLTSGPALHGARRVRHPNVQCVPNAVDVARFAPARLDAGSAHAADTRRLQQHLPRPRLGFFGVVDERMDLALVALMAQSHPGWQLVMVGPVVKIDPATLPRAPNLHWLGLQPYSRLPHLMAGWDVCLMPFAQHAATRHINPTKALEYLAGGKPVVSTPVGDVAALHGGLVRIADAGPAFVQACADALAETPDQRAQRQAAAAQHVQQWSWDTQADTVHRLLMDLVAQQQQQPQQQPQPQPQLPAPASTRQPLAACQLP